MNLAMEARDLYNENEKILIKETIQHTSKKPYAHIHIQTHTEIYTFIQNHMHKHKHIHTNAHI